MSFLETVIPVQSVIIRRGSAIRLHDSTVQVLGALFFDCQIFTHWYSKIFGHLSLSEHQCWNGDLGLFFFLEKILQKGIECLAKSLFSPYKYVSAINGDHE